MATVQSFNVVTIQNGTVQFNHAEMKSFGNYQDLNIEEILYSKQPTTGFQVLGFFGKSNGVKTRLKKMGFDVIGSNTHGICIINHKRPGKVDQIYCAAILPDCCFTRYQIGYIPTSILWIMMKLCTRISFCLSESDVSLLNQINQLYLTRDEFEFRTQRTQLPELKFLEENLVDEDQVVTLISGYYGAFAAQKRLPLEMKWESKQVTLASFSDANEWISEQSQQFVFSFGFELQDKLKEKLLNCAQLMLKHDEVELELEVDLPTPKGKRKMSTKPQTTKKKYKVMVASVWKTYCDSLTNTSDDLLMEMTSMKRTPNGIQCAYRVQRLIGSGFEFTVTPFTPQVNQRTFQLLSEPTNHWMFTLDDSRMLLVLVIEEHTEVVLIQEDNEVKQLGRFETMAIECDFLPDENLLAIVSNGLVDVYQGDPCLLIKRFIIPTVWCATVCSSDQLLVGFQNQFKTISIRGDANEFSLVELPETCIKPFMMCSGKILGALSLKSKRLYFSAFAIGNPATVKTVTMDQEIEHFTSIVSNNKLCIFDHDRSSVSSYEISYTTILDDKVVCSGLDMTWVYVIKLVQNAFCSKAIQAPIQASQSPYRFICGKSGKAEATFGEYVKNLTDESIPMQSPVKTTHVNVNSVLCQILTSVPFPLAKISLLLSEITKPCFVLCATGRTTLRQMLNCMTGSSFIAHSTLGNQVWVTMKPQDDYLVVIIDWSGLQNEQDELTALTFCANVANYTICSTESSTTLALLQQIPSSDMLPKRCNSGPLCFVSKTNMASDGVNSFVSTHFGGHIDTIVCNNNAKLWAPCSRVLLAYRDRACDSTNCYPDGKQCLDRISMSQGGGLEVIPQ